MADKERMELKRVAALVLCIAREEKNREDEKQDRRRERGLFPGEEKQKQRDYNMNRGAERKLRPESDKRVARLELLI